MKQKDWMNLVKSISRTKRNTWKKYLDKVKNSKKNKQINNPHKDKKDTIQYLKEDLF